MKIERAKNATRNIIFGTILKLYQIIVPFLMRTAMIYFLGVQYLGLDSLFTSILQILNLAELGVGSAMVFSMYKPIAEDDDTQICALMKLYKIYYRVIGMVILVVGLIICPFIPNLIKSDLPSDLNVYVLYIMNLFATVLSYWLFAYKNCLLQAYQRTDVTSKISLVIYSIRYLAQFIVLLVFKSYYLYLIVTLLGQVVLNISTAIVVNKIYPKYKANGELDKKVVKDINQRVKDLFTAKIGVVVLTSADTIVISSFLGLTMLAIYQNYFYIITAITGIVAVIFNACTAGIGNSIIVETEEKNYNDLKKFTFLIATIIAVCTNCLLNLFQPFMIFWVGEELLLTFPCVICLCVYYYIYEINTLLNTYKDSAGIWHKDRFRPLITAIANLILNIILVNIIGIYGVLISTFLTMLLIGMPWLIYNLFTEIFKRSAKEYVINLIKYSSVTILICIVSYYICNLISGYNLIFLIIRVIICCIIALFMWGIIFFKTKEMKESFQLVKKVLKKF